MSEKIYAINFELLSSDIEDNSLGRSFVTNDLLFISNIENENVICSYIANDLIEGRE